MVQFCVGALLFPAWYAFLLYLALRIFGSAVLLPVGLGLPVAGLFAREYFRYMKTRRRLLRFAALEIMLGVRVQELRLERRRLVANLDRAMEQYLSALEEEA